MSTGRDAPASMLERLPSQGPISLLLVLAHPYEAALHMSLVRKLHSFDSFFVPVPINILYHQIVASLWLAACCLSLEAHPKFLTSLFRYLYPAAGHARNHGSSRYVIILIACINSPHTSVSSPCDCELLATFRAKLYQLLLFRSAPDRRSSFFLSLAVFNAHTTHVFKLFCCFLSVY